MTQPRSLTDEIADAESTAEIDRLLQKGETFQFASDRTRNGWRKAASRRRVELKNGNDGQSR